MSRKTHLLQTAVCATALSGAFIAGRATIETQEPPPARHPAAPKAPLI